VRAFDPATGRLISPIIAAALCVKPRGLLTNNQAVKADALKSERREFTTMRGLAMRFRGVLLSKNVAKLGVWLTDAHKSGLYAMQRFARNLRRDIDAVKRRQRELEQRSSRRTDQPAENLQASDVRSSSSRTLACADVAALAAVAHRD
jgi:hypothetical protein